MTGSQTRLLGEAAQFRRRVDLQFFHDAGAMRLDRALGGTQVGGDFLVQFSGGNLVEDFAFARCQDSKCR